jgi:hypothetical protein
MHIQALDSPRHVPDRANERSGVARFTPHSAFDLPDIPPDALLRQSIEIRCLVTYS